MAEARDCSRANLQTADTSCLLPSLFGVSIKVALDLYLLILKDVSLTGNYHLLENLAELASALLRGMLLATDYRTVLIKPIF